MIRILLLITFWGANFPAASAWSSGASTHTAFSQRTVPSLSPVILHDAAEGEQEDFKRKMAMVRSLQMSYYKSNNFTHTSFDPATGTVQDLPLWRVGWTELPGRSNILSVHEPMYTNMFESILYKDKPWYIGHLYLPDGSKNMKRDTGSGHADENTNRAFKLKTWEDEIQEGEEKEYPRSAVVGTLMRIADYRRMEDGKLLLLVEALERFVVTNVKQEFPYSIADVQLLPDTEEVDPDVWVDYCTEGEIRDARSLALAESFQRYFPYEYDEQFSLPIPQKKDLQIQDVTGSLLTLVLPYVPLSKTADLSALKDKPLDFELQGGKEEGGGSPVVELNFDEFTQPSQLTDEQPCLEKQLLKGQVLRDFEHSDEAVTNLSLDALEYRLWIEINDFLQSTKTPVSPVLLGLLPPGVKWPSNFHLRKVANGIAHRTDLKHNFVQVSPLLPLHRRLRRLSYSATTLLENKPGMEGLKQELLECASTRARLLLVLKKIQEYNLEKVWGQFE